MDCPGVAGSTVQLCYGLQPPTAQFAVCYNKNTLIPDFTAHIVRPGIVGGGRDTDWRADTGKFGKLSLGNDLLKKTFLICGNFCSLQLRRNAMYMIHIVKREVTAALSNP